MDRSQSPFVLGAGSPPGEFAAYQRLRQKFQFYLAHLQPKPDAMGLVLIGRPDIGEAVLRDRMVRIKAARELPPPRLASKAVHQILQCLKALAGLVTLPIPASNGDAAGLDDKPVLRQLEEIEAAVFNAREDDPCLPALIASLDLRNWVTSD